MDEGDYVAIGMTLLGASFAWAGGRNVLRGRRNRAWRSVDGVVLSSEIEVVEAQGDDDVDCLRPVVTYRYIVGHPRTGTRIGVEAEFISNLRERAERWVDRYPRGKQVRVYYDPDDPDDAVLERGEGNMSVFFLFIGLVVLVGDAIYWLRESSFVH